MKKNIYIVFLMSLFALLSSKTFATELECRQSIVEVASVYGIKLTTDSFSTHSTLKDLLLTAEEFNELTLLEQETYYELLRPLSSVVEQYTAMIEKAVKEVFQYMLMSGDFETWGPLSTKFSTIEKSLKESCKNI